MARQQIESFKTGVGTALGTFENVLAAKIDAEQIPSHKERNCHRTPMHARVAATALIMAFAFTASAAAETGWSQAPAPSSTHAQSAIGARNDPGICRLGEPLWVLYIGSWYAAKAINGPDAEGRCLVSYDGFGPSYDEWVGPERLTMKEAGATQPNQEEQPSSPQGNNAPGLVTAGTYECYTLDAGQLNYAYTDIVITSAEAYAVGTQGGGYAVSAGGAMTFTGPLSNATGLYSIKGGSRPNIDITFNGDARSSMTCTKSR